MSNPWDDSGSSGNDEENNQAESQMRTAISTNALDNLPIDSVEEGINSIEDIELLNEAKDKSRNDDVLELVDNRLDELGNGVEDNEDGEEDSDMPETEESMIEESSIEDIAPNVITAEEARNEDKVWRVLVWGDPSVGKSHYSYTMPSPVCIIDTEGKAGDIAHKFEDTFFIWKPTNYDEAMEMLHEALDVLDHYRSEKGQTGTVVVDSMSILWEWSQRKYVNKFYPNSSYEEEKDNFSSGFGGGQSDWKRIKSYHSDFRGDMINSPYHLCWTQMAEQDYSAKMEDNIDRMKPVGEKNNVYKVDHIINISQNDSGVPTGTLEKSGLTKYRFSGLEYPTFPKMKEVVNSIEEAELSDDVDVDELTDYDISVMEGNPRFTGEE